MSKPHPAILSNLIPAETTLTKAISKESRWLDSQQLPAQKNEEHPSQKQRRNFRSGSDFARFEVSTVLCVSDDDYVRCVVRAYLEHVGFKVRCCSDASRAPELFFREPTVDLLLIDVDALGTAGLSLAAGLAAFSRDLPIVVISAVKSEELSFPGRSWGNWHFLAKPIVVPELLEVIRGASCAAKESIDRVEVNSGLSLDRGPGTKGKIQ
jgi:CheY-like chemotaxis protein